MNIYTTPLHYFTTNLNYAVLQDATQPEAMAAMNLRDNRLMGQKNDGNAFSLSGNGLVDRVW